MDYATARKKFVDWIRKQLIGPVMPEGESLTGISPLDRFPCGVLFPVIESGEGLDPATLDPDAQVEEEIDESTESSEIESGNKAEPTVRRRRYVPPSSVGFSFFVPGNDWEFHVRFSAVRYEQIEERDAKGRYRKQEYKRKSLGGDEDAVNFSSSSEFQGKDVMDGRAGIAVQARPHDGGQIVTVSLFNKQSMEAYNPASPRDYQAKRCNMSLFEVELHCYIDHGEVGDYPRVEYSLLSEEDQELELQYKSKKIYAVGHGAAVDWQASDGRVQEIFSDFMPTVEVPQMAVDVSEDQVLEFERLATLDQNPDAVCEQLQKFVNGYADWADGQSEATNILDAQEKPAGERIVGRMQKAVERMCAGIALLRSNSKAAQAFSLANQAMLDQIQRGDINKLGKPPVEKPRWRPFQLAFILATVEATIDENSDCRDLVDLIWFPTGGGKTEAYLGLIAFLVIWRRLKYTESGGGTTALMRYTLRLLTRQQYQRATRMICALELLRKGNPKLGKEPITIGLWVGGAASPNTFREADECIDRSKQGNTGDLEKLVLKACPWCEGDFTAPRNFQATETEFHFRCINKTCEFGSVGSGVLPCQVVDEALYESPPTLMLATLDKFARLAWEERANVFFGDKGNRPPELIIQDELHLVAGPLGSVAGLYEAAFEAVLNSCGVNPKYIASTATIRMATDQVRKLYGREVAVFPPPGLDSDDSYFARKIPIREKPGRLYLGYFAPTLDRQHCMAPLSAVLLRAPESLFGQEQSDQGALLDAWWTQVVYHGSLKGVGNSHNVFNIDVRDIYARLSLEAQADNSNPLIMRRSTSIEQLTSNNSAEKNAQTFGRLEHERTHQDALDAVLATNMVSVGLDVDRLALMVINGQPLTTAEYIQSSSRVGRSDVPGIVCTNYYRDQARSLAHYENFRPYHESFYRSVEPTSITPFTWQTRRRALHAALVISVRHSCSQLLVNKSAGDFDPNDERVKKVIEILKQRCTQADPDHATEIGKHIDTLVGEWCDRATQACRGKFRLSYQGPRRDRAIDRLLYSHDDKIEGLWLTLNSMRNIESSGVLKVL